MESEKRSEALLFGSLLHKGLEAFWETKTEDSGAGNLEVAVAALKDEAINLDIFQQSGPYMPKLAELMLEAYCQKWRDDKYCALAVEKEFVLPMLDPVTNEQYNGWRISGKIDAIVKDLSTGQTFLMDHKTAAGDVGAGSIYWKRLHFDPQISMYYHAAKRLGFDICGFVYDVLSKPNMDPKKATPPHKRKYKKSGEPYWWVVEEDETPEAYEDRLRADLDRNFETTFTRKVFTRTEDQLDAFQEELCSVAKRLDSTTSAESALRNPTACFMYRSECAYIEACAGGDIENLENVCIKEPFPELDELEEQDV